MSILRKNCTNSLSSKLVELLRKSKSICEHNLTMPAGTIATFWVNPAQLSVCEMKSTSEYTVTDCDLFCNCNFAPSNSVVVLHVSIAISGEINRKHYFRRLPCVCVDVHANTSIHMRIKIRIYILYTEMPM